MKQLFFRPSFLYLIGCTFLTFSMLSCNDSSLESTPPIEYREDELLVEYEYRIDNSVVSPYTVSITDSTNIYLYEIGLTSSLSGYTKTIVHKFTTSAYYYSYADTKGVPAEEYDLITDSLAYYADFYNMNSIVAADEEIPAQWGALEASMCDKIIPRAAVSQLNDDWRNICRNQHNDGSNQIFSFPLIGMPSLGFLGWRNRISSFRPLILGGVDKVYRRAFYHTRIGTIWSWGFTTIDFCGPLARFNNASNSWWSAGV